MRIDTQASRCNEEVVKAHAQSLEKYKQILAEACSDASYASHEALLHTPFDTTIIEQSQSIKERMGTAVRRVVLVGIGGSDLGTRAIYDAITLRSAGLPELICFDTIEPGRLARAKEVFAPCTSPEEVVLVVVSKSGTTTESIVNANILFSALAEKFGVETAGQRTICIGDVSSQSAEIQASGVTTVAMPDTVGGRFSVFSHVGLVPLALLGLDVHQFTEGARKALTAVTAEGYGPATVLASILFENYTSGYTTHDLYLFHPELQTLGKWYRQLLAESLGKEREDGTQVGITPSVCIGSTDLHSMGQLVFGGPRTRWTTFVASPTEWSREPVILSTQNPFTLPMLKGKSATDAIDAIYRGTKEAYAHEGLPYVTTELGSISEHELGSWMALQMATIMFAAQLFDVDAFSQPAVEHYKTRTRAILNGTDA